MRIQIDQKELSLAVQRSSGVILDKTLAYLALKAESDKIQICSASQSIIIYTESPCEILEEGHIFVPAKLFFDVVRQLPEGQITLQVSDKTLKIEASNDKIQEFFMKIPLIDDKDWKNPPDIQTENSAVLPTDKLLYAIEQIQFCVSFESSRNYGTVALLHKPTPNSLRLVGSDGFRLSYSELRCELSDSFLGEDICLSKKALLELQKMCSEGYNSISLSVSDDKSALFASAPGYIVCIRLTSINYPKYEGALPKGDLTPIEVPRTQIQNVAKRVMLAADKSHTLQLAFGGDRLVLFSRTVGGSEGKESILLDGFKGKDMNIAINGKYFTDVFSTISSDKIILNIKKNKDPFILKPLKEPKDCQSTHVLVPIKQN